MQGDLSKAYRPFQTKNYHVGERVVGDVSAKHVPIRELVSLLRAFALGRLTGTLPSLLRATSLRDSSYERFLLTMLRARMIKEGRHHEGEGCSTTRFPPGVEPLRRFSPRRLSSKVARTRLSGLGKLS